MLDSLNVKEWKFHSLVRVVAFSIFWEWKSLGITLSEWNWNKLHSKWSWKYLFFTHKSCLPLWLFARVIWRTKRVFFHSFTSREWNGEIVATRMHYESLTETCQNILHQDLYLMCSIIILVWYYAFLQCKSHTDFKIGTKIVQTCFVFFMCYACGTNRSLLLVRLAQSC